MECYVFDSNCFHFLVFKTARQFSLIVVVFFFLNGLLLIIEALAECFYNNINSKKSFVDQ